MLTLDQERVYQAAQAWIIGRIVVKLRSIDLGCRLGWSRPSSHASSSQHGHVHLLIPKCSAWGRRRIVPRWNSGQLILAVERVSANIFVMLGNSMAQAGRDHVGSAVVVPYQICIARNVI